MDASHGEDRRPAAEPDPYAPLRMLTEMADATFDAEGIAMGLPLKWIERAPLSEDLPPRLLARRGPDGGTRVSADR